MIRFIPLLALVLVTASSLAQISIRKVKPGDTDPQITTFNTDSHYVYYPAGVTQRNVLVVHLPGSFGEPKRATLFGKLAADLGFHSIGLMYPNVPTVGSFCTNSSSAECFEEVRREIVEGGDFSPEISIPLHESILSRTKRLIAYLNANFPTENWGQYLSVDGELRFSNLIFSGHSQGGGHAALIAKYHPLQRAICFSSPKDWRNASDSPPLWLSSGIWQTPANRLYVFNHTLDEHVNRQLDIWDAMGLNNLGTPVGVESQSPPYTYTRQLTTSFGVPPGDDHACTIQDNKTPKVSGVPVFLPVWTYMLTNELVSGNQNGRSRKGEQPLWLFPNPVQDIVWFTSDSDWQLLKLFNVNGKCLLEKQKGEGVSGLDLTFLDSGVYFLHVAGKATTRMGKVLKQ